MDKKSVIKWQNHLVDLGYDLGSWGELKNGVDGDLGGDTLKATSRYIFDLCVNNSYVYKKTGSGLFWFRTSGTFDDKFSDFVAVVKNGKCVSISNATTKPGHYWVNNPVTVGGITGTGCRVSGQTLNSHKYIRGRNKWKGSGYFKQIESVLIHRDGNKDKKLDKNIVKKAPPWYGFFLHPMGSGRRVWNWSAGCLGTPLNQWKNNIDPYFNNGNIINDTIFDI